MIIVPLSITNLHLKTDNFRLFQYNNRKSEVQNLKWLL